MGENVGAGVVLYVASGVCVWVGGRHENVGELVSDRDTPLASDATAVMEAVEAGVRVLEEVRVRVRV